MHIIIGAKYATTLGI